MFAKHHLAAVAALGIAATAATAAPQPSSLDQQTTPDRLEMKDGRALQGLILKNTADSVLFQTRTNEMLVPKEQIRRIHDEIDGDIVFEEIASKGRLPSWRAMVTDLRNHDDIRSLQQIPATTIEEGFLRNIPYLSFRVNKQSEFNVYGNPLDPVAIEFGMYGRQRNSSKYRQIIREFLAGHLHAREEIAALYSLNLRGDEKRAGQLAFKIIPPGQADAYGGWWLVVYDPQRLDRSRVTDAKYAAVTRPFTEINNRDGSLRVRNQQEQQNWLATMMEDFTGRVPQIRGFYRDKDGIFRLFTFGDDES
ncbi:MAG: hypothetical protein WEC73_05850 [Chthoniobacterales bacterium]